ncbi:MAG: hypothetical protein QOG71_1267 [Pyrinomonadaceae bacterium]|nr:hypothetical protein [Pyrinomonadaceae bacterium]
MIGANNAPAVTGQDELPGRVNFVNVEAATAAALSDGKTEREKQQARAK